MSSKLESYPSNLFWEYYISSLICFVHFKEIRLKRRCKVSRWGLKRGVMNKTDCHSEDAVVAHLGQGTFLFWSHGREMNSQMSDSEANHVRPECRVWPWLGGGKEHFLSLEASVRLLTWMRTATGSSCCA